MRTTPRRRALRDTAGVVLPRIVVTLSGRATQRNEITRRQYLASVENSGVEVVALTPSDEMPREFDGLYLSGGEDIDPGRYREGRNGSEIIDPARDELEFDLLATALERDIPVLGVCRGFQVLNVHFGGSLEQHVVGHRAKELGIPDDPESAEAVRHAVQVETPSLLAQACGETFTVNSSHHQVVTPSRFAKNGLRATVTYGGIVEALESERHRWIVGVQWHPERTKQVDEAAGRIFDAFVRAAERVPAR